MRDSFVIHTAYAEKFKRLSDEQFGKLMRLLMQYQDTGCVDTITDDTVAIAFDVAKVELDITNQKYEEVCEKRRIAGSKGGLAKVANATNCKQKVAKGSKTYHKDKDKDKDNDNDNDISISNDINNNHLEEKDIEILDRESQKEKVISLSEKRFEEFWKLYPRRVGKDDARKKWNKINPNAELFEKIMNAVRENIDHNPQWQRQNGQFIPHPSTWLNQGRWDDDINSLEHEDYFTRELKKMGGISFE